MDHAVSVYKKIFIFPKKTIKERETLFMEKKNTKKIIIAAVVVVVVVVGGIFGFKAWRGDFLPTYGAKSVTLSSDNVNVKVGETAYISYIVEWEGEGKAGTYKLDYKDTDDEKDMMWFGTEVIKLEDAVLVDGTEEATDAEEPTEVVEADAEAEENAEDSLQYIEKDALKNCVYEEKDGTVWSIGFMTDVKEAQDLHNELVKYNVKVDAAALEKLPSKHEEGKDASNVETCYMAITGIKAGTSTATFSGDGFEKTVTITVTE